MKHLFYSVRKITCANDGDLRIFLLPNAKYVATTKKRERKKGYKTKLRSTRDNRISIGFCVNAHEYEHIQSGKNG